MADAGQHVGLGVGGALGEAPGFAQLAFAVLGLRQVAEHRKEIRAVGAGAPHRHRQRDHAKKQYETLTAQAKELAELSQKVATETVEPIKASASKFYKPAA